MLRNFKFFASLGPRLRYHSAQRNDINWLRRCFHLLQRGNYLSVKKRKTEKVLWFHLRQDTAEDKYDGSETEKIVKGLLLEKTTFRNCYESLYELGVAKDTCIPEELIDKYQNHLLPTSVKEIDENSKNLSPVIGSLVVIDDIDHNCLVGVVLRESQAIFNNSYNKLLVLTQDNKIIEEYASNLKFHLYGLLDLQLVGSLGILENRHDSLYFFRQDLITFMKAFIGKAYSYLELLDDPTRDQLDIAYTQFAGENHINSVSIQELFDSFLLLEPFLASICCSYFNACSLIFSVYLGMVKSPKWLVSSSWSTLNNTNIFENRFSNEIYSGPNYFVNSIANIESIAKFIDDCNNPDSLKSCNIFLNNLISEQRSDRAKSLEEMGFFFNIWEGRQFKHIVDTLKFFIIYPHTVIKKRLCLLEIFKMVQINPENVHKLLADIGIYDSEENIFSSIILSSNLAGSPKLNLLSVASVDDLNPSPTKELLLMALRGNSASDKFPHFRRNKELHEDLKVYGLPVGFKGDGNYSALAVSIEKINSRKHVVRLHIPDIVTKVAPSSQLFEALRSQSFNMRSKGLLKQAFAQSMFAEDFIREMTFKDQYTHMEDDFFSVGDILGHSKKSFRGNLKNMTCLTLSYIFNKYDSHLLKDLDVKVDYSFDSLNSVQVKVFDWESLENCLNGSSEYSAFKLFKGSKSTKNEKSTKFNNEDIHNINFIFNIMKRHFSCRNIRGASNIHPSNTSRQELKPFSQLDQLEDHFSRLDERKQSKPFSKSFIEELKMFLANLAAEVSKKYGIPLIVKSQKKADSLLFENSSDEKVIDEALVTHENSLLPNFYAASYGQTLLARGSDGYVSTGAHFVALAFLDKPLLDIPAYCDSDSEHIPLGLENGYPDIVDVFNSYDAFINQLQVLAYLQANTKYKKSPFHDKDKRNLVSRPFGYLKRHGYNIHGPLPAETLRFLLPKISNAYKVEKFLSLSQWRYWMLRVLHQKISSHKGSAAHKAPSLTCVVTGPHSSKICRALCLELDIEVDVYTDADQNFCIGSYIECEEVLSIKPSTGFCLLRMSQLIQ